MRTTKTKKVLLFSFPVHCRNIMSGKQQLFQCSQEQEIDKMLPTVVKFLHMK